MRSQALILLLAPGCISLDAFVYNPEKLDQYSLSGDVIPGSQIELVSFSSEDLTLYGAWARQTEPAPVIVHFHGNDGNIDVHWDRVETYWSWGYDVFIFDYRGYGRSEGEPSLEGLEADGLAAVETVSNSLGVESRDLHYVGLSLGGAVAIRTARDLPPLSLTSEDTFADLDLLLDSSASDLRLGAGWFFNEDWDNVAAMREVEDVPTFVIHAAEDQFVPTVSGDRLYAAAPDPKQKWHPPGADHADSYTVVPDQYRQRLTGWMDFATTYRAAESLEQSGLR